MPVSIKRNVRIYLSNNYCFSVVSGVIVVAMCRRCKGSGASPIPHDNRWVSCDACSGLTQVCECGAPLSRWGDEACSECKKAAQHVLDARYERAGTVDQWLPRA